MHSGMKGSYLIIILITIGFFVFHIRSKGKIDSLKEDKIKLKKELESCRFRNFEYYNNLTAHLSFSLLDINGFIDYLSREGELSFSENCENKLILIVPVDVCGICLNSLFKELSNAGQHCPLLVSFEEDLIIERTWRAHGFSLDQYYNVNNNYSENTFICNELVLFKINSNNELITMMVYNYQLPEFLNIFLNQ